MSSSSSSLSFSLSSALMVADCEFHFSALRFVKKAVVIKARGHITKDRNRFTFVASLGKKKSGGDKKTCIKYVNRVNF